MAVIINCTITKLLILSYFINYVFACKISFIFL